MSYLQNDDRHSLTARVFQNIREAIIDGRYHNGDYLVETKLAEEYGVSRTPIREALKQLELENLVVSIPNRGVVVQSITKEDINDIYTIRYLLEGQAAYWAAQRIQAEQLNQLAELVELMDLYTRRNDGMHLAKLDTEFHNVIYEASNSRNLKHILASLHQHAQQVRESSLNEPHRASVSLEEHMSVFHALENHDAALAKTCMEKHILSAATSKNVTISCKTE